MIAILDIETQGLHAGRFVLGGLYLETGKCYIFRSKEELWDKILAVAAKEDKRNKKLTVYAHNAVYDVFGTVPVTDPEFRLIKTTNPHISEFRNIQFYDSLGLFKTSLANVGKLLGKHKIKTREWLLKEEYEPSELQLLQASSYLKRDLEIPLLAIQKLKTMLSKHGMRPRRLVTRGQIAISYVIKQLKKSPFRTKIFDSGRNEQGVPYFHYGKLWGSDHAELIHLACRGGRVQAFQTGRFPSATHIDINSHYAQCASLMRFPDLRTQRHIIEPQKNGWPLHLLIPKYGLSTAIVRLPDDLKVGFLQLRTAKDCKQPAGPGIVVGTWTHDELVCAVRNGHEILHIYESLIWETLPGNPLKGIYEDLYEFKEHAPDDFSRQFYKDLLNHSTGKWAQRTKHTVSRFDTIEAYPDMAEDGYLPIVHIEGKVLYQQKTVPLTKTYYAPSIYAHITAWGRILLWDALKQLPTQDLLYCDTDSIAFKHSNASLEKFKYGTGLGKWKIEERAQPMLIWSKKTYKIGDKMKVSGASKNWVDEDDFNRGYVQYKRMLPLNRITCEADIGSFEDIHRELSEPEQDDVPSQLHIDHGLLKTMTPEQLTTLLTLIPETLEASTDGN